MMAANETETESNDEIKSDSGNESKAEHGTENSSTMEDLELNAEAGI